ncbi:rhodanese-like domain-containing protein [Roseivirga sp.]|uniref:rhodanese-like domain-containing protein n=1 Tax=Roseivirga sp. TaxID=1964215 RepID=UPI003B8E0137
MIRVFLSVLVLFSVCSPNVEQAGTIAKAITVIEFQKVIAENEDIQIIDVRTEREFQSGHLEKAVLIDYYKPDFKSLLQKLDKSKPIAVYCAVGGRSSSTLKILKAMGFKEAYDMKGGIRAWQKEKLPIER